MVKQGLPRTGTPPTLTRMQRGLPQRRRIRNVEKIVAVSSAKGGVGKSTLAGMRERNPVSRFIIKNKSIELISEDFLSHRSQHRPLARSPRSPRRHSRYGYFWPVDSDADGSGGGAALVFQFVVEHTFFILAIRFHN